MNTPSQDRPYVMLSRSVDANGQLPLDRVVDATLVEEVLRERR